jgi:hypothetical protein
MPRTKRAALPHFADGTAENEQNRSLAYATFVVRYVYLIGDVQTRQKH